MSFVLFLRGLVGVLLVFAIVTYAFTQSIWSTFIQTVICAVLLQIGYFAAILFLVWRSGPKVEERAPKEQAPQISPNADQPAGKVGGLSGVPRSRHP